jgi:anti-sigma factor RsiW
MLIPNHPDDERLSALASGDSEAVADSALSDHVASCIRCADTVAELGALRTALADLPDLQPHRPLQLLPPVADVPARADRVGGWARRIFAPMLTAGAALAMVGLVGTAGPLFGGADSGAAPAAEADMALPAASSADADAAGGETYSARSAVPAAAPTAGEGAANEEPTEEPRLSEMQATNQDDGGSDTRNLASTEQRPIWPMLLFAGVAIMIAAALLRWILAPRAG